MRRTLILLALAALLAACVPVSNAPAPEATTAVASSVPSAPVAPPVVVRFAPDGYNPEIQASPYAALVAQFNQRNPDVRVELVSTDDLLKGVEGQPYDELDRARRILSGADVAAAPYDLERVVALGFVKDLTPFIVADASFRRDDFAANALGASSVDERFYSVPWLLQVPLLLYNKSLWEARGLTPPKPDWSWDDLLRVAATLARKQGGTVETYGLKEDISINPFLHLLSKRSVNVLSTPLAQVRLDTREAVAALGELKALVDSGAIYMPPRNADGSFAGASAYADLVRDGNIGVWEYELTAGEHASLPTPPYPLGVALAPPSLLGGGRLSSQGYVMSSGTQHPEAAWRWLSFVSRQVVRDPNYAGAEYVPARSSIADAAGYWKGLAPDVAAMVRAALAAPPSTRPAPNSQTRDAVLQALLPALSDVMGGGKDVPAALRDAQVKLAEVGAQGGSATQPTAGALTVVTPTSASANAEAVRISFGNAGFDSQMVARMAEAFNKAQVNVIVSVEALSNGNGIPEPAEVAASVDCFDYYRPLNADEAMSSLLDLGPLIAADAGFPRDDYPKALLARFKRDGKQYALPHGVGFRMLAYNPVLFNAAKRPYPHGNWSFNDLRAAATALTSRSRDNPTYGWGLVYDSVAAQASTFAEQNGAPLVRGSSNTLGPNFTDSRVVPTLRAYVEMVRASAPPAGTRNYASEDYANYANGLMYDGQVGMWVTSYIPVKAISNAKNVYRVAIAPLPTSSQGSALPSFYGWGLSISARTPHADACWAWMQYLEANGEGYSGAFPARRSVASSPQFVALAPDGARDVYAAFAAALDRAPANATSLSVWEPPMTGIWLTQALDRALQGGDLQAELADAQFKTEQYLQCVRGGETEDTCKRQVDPSYKP